MSLFVLSESFLVLLALGFNLKFCISAIRLPCTPPPLTPEDLCGGCSGRGRSDDFFNFTDVIPAKRSPELAPPPPPPTAGGGESCLFWAICCEVGDDRLKLPPIGGGGGGGGVSPTGGGGGGAPPIGGGVGTLPTGTLGVALLIGGGAIEADTDLVSLFGRSGGGGVFPTNEREVLDVIFGGVATGSSALAGSGTGGLPVDRVAGGRAGGCSLSP